MTGLERSKKKPRQVSTPRIRENSAWQNARILRQVVAMKAASHFIFLAIKPNLDRDVES
jgi:hypothetical protein